MRVVGARRHAGIYLESTGDEQYGVLPGEERLVKEVMSRHVVMIDVLTTVKQAAEIMQARKVPALVVCRKEDVAGVVTERELALRGTTGSRHPSAVSVQDILAGCEPVGCREDAILGDVTRAMIDHRLPAVPVMTAGGDVVGVLSLLDAAGAVMPNVAATWRKQMSNEGG